MAYGTAPYGDAAYGQDSQEGAQQPTGLPGQVTPTEQQGQDSA